MIGKTIDTSRLSADAVRVFRVIVDAIGADGFACCGTRYLAERLRLPRPVVQDLVREIEASGLIRSRRWGATKIYEIGNG